MSYMRITVVFLHHGEWNEKGTEKQQKVKNVYCMNENCSTKDWFYSIRLK